MSRPPAAGPSGGPPSALERRVRAVLEQSVSRVDAHARSRLNRARQAALEAAAARRRSRWRMRVLMPLAGATMMAVLAAGLVLFGVGSRQPAAPAVSRPPLEVLDLLSDGDSMTLMEHYDRGFYEWAATEAQGSNGSSSGSKPTT
ncbi:MAG: hypothetical protein ACREU3_15525 [Steroidobacteraceae bacterium]